MSKIRKGLGVIVTIEKYICCVLLVLMLIICFTAVVMRYAFSSPLVWSEEVILTFLVWFGFLCISIGVFGDEHIAIEGLYNTFPAVVKKGLDVLRHILLLVFGIFMTYYGWKVFKINLVKRLPATHWPQGLQYFPMVVGGVLTTIYSAVNLVEELTGKKEKKEGKEI